MMTCERGYELAAKQRPGVVIVMGPVSATERMISPLRYHERRALDEKPGPNSWLERDLGFNLSPWAYSYGMALMSAAERHPTRAEWEWLNSNQTSKRDADEWLRQNAKNKQATQ